ncbi:hypothetical protein BGW80DRAFT_1460932 [Lactifluus volemus]|nr:hypothetical protein BGW80DRAFT_1460932 [Lactifluus volemus]
MNSQIPPKLYHHDFLAHPPSPWTRSKVPHPPTPVRTSTRRRSSTISAISAWAARVAPGSPSPVSPPATPVPCRPSIFAPSSFARRHSVSFLSPTDAPTHDPKVHSLNLCTPGYACTVVPLPVTSYDSALDLAEKEDLHAGGHFSSPPNITEEEGTYAPLPHSSAFPLRWKYPHLPAPSSVRTSKVPPLSSLPSPNTAVFLIAHKKRMLYAERGALPLPLDSEVALKQFLTVGRAQMPQRDRAQECLPLLLATESGADEFDAVDALSDTVSASGSLTVASIPISPLPSNTPPVPSSLVQQLTPTTPRALFSIPARAQLRKGRDAHGSVYLHTPLPLPRHSSGSGPVELQFSSPWAPAESCRKQRRWLVPPALRLPVQPFGFEDSFSPAVVIQGEGVEP